VLEKYYCKENYKDVDSLNDNRIMTEKSSTTDYDGESMNTELHSVWNKHLSTGDHQILESAMKFFIKISTATGSDT
jgi:hypothetical protein